MAVISKVLVAALVAGAVNALPQQGYQKSSTAPYPTATGVATPAATPPMDADMISQIVNAPSQLDKFKSFATVGGLGKMLKSVEELAKFVIFDFKSERPANQLGGVAKGANVDNFPILSGLGIATTLGFLEPCGMNTPHVHPRATEFLTLVEGSDLKFGYVLENGLVEAGQNAEIAGTLQKFQGTVFPIGSIHYQFNDSPDCTPATFVAALNSDDPGTNQIAQGFFGLNPDIVNATLGFPKQIDGSNIAQFRKSIPPNLAQGIDSCLARCKRDIANFPLPTPAAR
ncbi:RmlC-like cupin domain-containing protein [Lophiotrema nucula]|uniref:RmlC-like cupin domain-containing protein n=1 Tax=Lophiotrema nucula TaxID=690887 RepID=A0A6A5ZAX3_9PLEO|nr:RmlC-like cupin domain-containing protein [Lophiotrema nucula]